MYLKWTCPECGDTVISIDKRHHQMDYCKCGKSYCDFETYSCRFGGNKIVELLQKKQFKTEKIDYDFFEEILICMDKQGIKLPFYLVELFPYGGVLLQDYLFIRKLEDKMLKDLK